MERIIVGTDFSKRADMAVDHALLIARTTGAEVVFAHVHPPTGEWETELTAVELDKLCKVAETDGLLASVQISRGRPEQQLAAIAAERDASLVVVASHGRTGAERFLVGSVAEGVCQTAKCDVLVARGAAPGYSKILVPTDFSTAADKALGRALELARRPANIELFHSWQVPVALVARPETKLAEEREAILAEATRQAASLIERHGTLDVELTFDTERGPAASNIQDKLAEADWDLVVMGSHGRSGIRRLFLGSVAEKTVRHSPCSVLVVHDRDS